ncbi:hypothetical protein [Polyangium jinanense]|uniref:Tetratricopeptide repeat protein n=1 Tax=Polyangium jinanense TaxID=2829994 RepID=A0A9X3XG32_9BACT|nr:hypothetical protein [Polyangium jinanense]MDC3962546.1 hypothetical protein [Polyangium jinanense]MDC3989367.1 hypothetical protein [Polyangium jinanense]
MWRDEDEALLARLTDEIVFERLFREQAGTDARPPARGAGLCAALRRLPGGNDAIEAARTGKLDALREHLEPARQIDPPPELLHHLALHHASLADRAGSSTDAFVRSITAWLALGRQETYLRDLGEAVTGSALARQDLDRALVDAPLWCIEDLGERARLGARELTADAQRALAALGRVPEAARIARAPEALAERAARRATSLVAVAVEEALAPVLAAFAEATTKGEPSAAEGAALLGRFVAVWRWSGADESVEHAAIEQATPLAWAHYRASRWDDLRSLIAPVEPLVDALARRIENDPSKLAYAARAAQMLVFRSDVVRTERETLELLDRAITICPTHRNARLMKANTLCDQALRLLPGARAPSRQDHDRAAGLIERAEQLYPAATRLPEARRRLGEARKLLGISS